MRACACFASPPRCAAPALCAPAPGLELALAPALALARRRPHAPVAFPRSSSYGACHPPPRSPPRSCSPSTATCSWLRSCLRSASSSRAAAPPWARRMPAAPRRALCTRRPVCAREALGDRGCCRAVPCRVVTPCTTTTVVRRVDDDHPLGPSGRRKHEAARGPPAPAAHAARRAVFGGTSVRASRRWRGDWCAVSSKQPALWQQLLGDPPSGARWRVEVGGVGAVVESHRPTHTRLSVGGEPRAGKGVLPCCPPAQEKQKFS